MDYVQPQATFRDATSIADRLKRISGGSLLDVATGDGDFIQVLLATLRGCDSVIGIDYAQTELAKAKNRLGTQPKVQFIQMSADTVAFQDESFDTVSIANSLHHLHHVEKVLTEMNRVLKRNGWFIVQEMYSDGDQTAAQQTEIMQHSWSAQIDTLLGVPHRSTFPRNIIQSMIRRLGLRNLEVFDSRYCVKCLSCPEVNKCIDPTYEPGIRMALQEIERDLLRVHSHPDFPQFRESALHLQERIRRYGVAPASILFFIGRK